MTLTGKYDSTRTMNTKKLILDKPYLFLNFIKKQRENINIKSLI